MKRSSGILLPIFSLPSPYGIGTIGKAAYEFIDFLSISGQTYWQVLPIEPAGSGNSPYQSFSAFAGNSLLIDIDMLIDELSLDISSEDKTALKSVFTRDVNYEDVIKNKNAFLRKAFSCSRNSPGLSNKLSDFFSKNSSWLSDYSLFMAIKDFYNGLPWNEWPDEGLRMHKKEALDAYEPKLKDSIDYYVFTQYFFFSQWAKLHDYASQKGIKLIGDMPIYVSADSSDVWSNPQFFMMDEKNVPTCVAGVPPDYFSETGQLWNNPIYNWANIKRDGYGFWIRRIDRAMKLYDTVRIDHFRGFESYWSVPYGEKTAMSGHWEKGPGMDLLGMLKEWFPNLSVIAEDLGTLTSEVKKLLSDSGFPGMKVLQFAFSGESSNEYLPHNYTSNCICYTGTHDNDTLLGWATKLSETGLEYVKKYLGISHDEDIPNAVIRLGMSSVAVLFITQMQDWLNLDSDCRTNTPSTVGKNWSFRLMPGELTLDLADKIRAITKLYGR